MEMNTEKTCKGFTRNHEPCMRVVRDGEDYCWQHKITLEKKFGKLRIGGFTLGAILTCITAFLGFFSDSFSIFDRFHVLPKSTPTIQVHGEVIFRNVDTIIGIDETNTNQTYSSNTEIEEIMDVVPFFIGSTWSYNTIEVTPYDDPQGTEVKDYVGFYTEKVVTIETIISSNIRLVQSTLIGNNYKSPCQIGVGTFTGEEDIWYVVDKERLFFTCREEQANQLIDHLIKEENDSSLVNLQSPDLLLPLEIGNLWSAFGDITERNDTNYQWHIVSKEDLRIPAGKITDCYKIVLYTLPDHTIRWFCPGYGLVVEEYHHHPPSVYFRTELSGFKVVTK